MFGSIFESRIIIFNLQIYKQIETYSVLKSMMRQYNIVRNILQSMTMQQGEL